MLFAAYHMSTLPGATTTWLCPFPAVTVPFVSPDTVLLVLLGRRSRDGRSAETVEQP